MTDSERIQIRCSGRARQAWREACGKFDLTYGEMALNAAKFIIENESEFRRFVYGEERKREDSRGGR